jgi:hypothetical protein
MKKATFNKPFNGMDNALKLIPESYKVDGNEFEVTDGIETYRVRWEGSLTEGKGAVLTANNSNLINEDMNHIKHLMGFKSEDTLGNLKGSERINENKSLKIILDKTKSILSEGKEGKETLTEMDGGYGFTSENNFGDNEMPEVEVTEMDMPGSSNLVGEMEDIVPAEEVNEEAIDESSITEEDEQRDVENVMNLLGDSSRISAAMKKINNRAEKIALAKELVKAIGGDAALISKIAREILADANTQSDVEAAEQGDEQVSIAQGNVAPTSGLNEDDVNEECNECDEKLEEMDTFDKIFEGMYEDVNEAYGDDVTDRDVNAQGSYEDLSDKQSKEMDTDKDGDIDAKDLKNLRDEK